MLPESIDVLAHTLRYFPGVGKRSSQKLALDILQLETEQFTEFTQAVEKVRAEVHFCKTCGFFAGGDQCEICRDTNRINYQICLLEKPTDVISVEKSSIYRGKYHVLKKLISPLDNIFAEDTDIPALVNRLKELVKQHNNIELILFFKAGFAGEATTAYLKDVFATQGLTQHISITRLAQGLPLYFNPETLDQATMVKALEDRRAVI